MSNPQGSFQSVNVSVNGVTKNLKIPLNSLPSTTMVPGTITVQPSQDALVSIQAQTAVSSASSTTQRTLALVPDLARSGQSDPRCLSAPQLTSFLSRCKGRGGGGHALVTVRPRTGVNGAGGGTEVEPRTAATAIGVPAGENLLPLVRTVHPGVKVAVPVQGSGLKGGGSVSVIRATQLVRPVGPSVIRRPMGAQDGPRSFQYVVQHGSPSVVGPVPPTTTTTILVKRVGLDEGPAAKKTVLIRMPRGSGSGETAAAAAGGVAPRGGVIRLKPGHVLVEARDSKTNAVRYIQMQRKDPERTSDVVLPVASSLPRSPPSPRSDSCPSVDEDEAAAAEDIKVTEDYKVTDDYKVTEDYKATHDFKVADDFKVTEDIKVIEIVPDDDADEPDEPVALSEYGNEKNGLPVATDIPTPPLSAHDRSDPLPDQEPCHSIRNSRSESFWISDALTCLSVDEATVAASALTLPSEDRQHPTGSTSDHRLNVIRNTGLRVDDEDGDGGADVTSADERCHGDKEEERFSLVAGHRNTFRRKVPVDSVCVSLDTKRSVTKTETETETAKRRSARPRAPFPVTAEGTGGGPKTAGERQRGADVVDCRVLLGKTNVSKPYTKWVARHLDQIRSGTGKPSNTRKPKQNDARIRVDGSGNFKSPGKESDRMLVLIRAKSEFSIPKCPSDAGMDAEKIRSPRIAKRMLTDLPHEVNGNRSLDLELAPVVRRKRAGRKSEPTDAENTAKNESYEENSAELGFASDPARTANRAKIRSRKKTCLDDITSPLNSSTQTSMGLDVPAEEIVPKCSDFSTDSTSTSNRRRSARKPKHELLVDQSQDGSEAVDQEIPARPIRKRAAKRKPIGVRSQWEGDFSTPGGAEGPSSESDGKKRRRRVSRSIVDPETFVDVAKSSSTVFAGPRQIFVPRSSLLKPIAARAAVSLPSPPKLIISTANSARPLVIKPTPAAAPALSSPAPSGSKPRGEETKYYLVKTEGGGSFLIPVPKHRSNTRPSPIAVAPPPPPPMPLETEDRVEAGDAEGAGSPGPPSSASQDQSGSDQTGEDYETAVSGMRQEDRISLLKEKLRQQKEQLSQLRRH